ncbi:MAG: uracil-DNA glycosylase [Candidatus Sericytochromatia bacterium]
MIKQQLNNGWDIILSDEFDKKYFRDLELFLEEEYKTQVIYPLKQDIFNAFKYTDYNDVKVLILGQDPYHGKGQAHGLSFSVLDNIALPPSLKNIFKELENDLGIKNSTGNLEKWARQGILMLNAVLTVREATPNSHKSKGWEKFTDSVIKKLNERDKPVIFLLWGNYAKKKASLIDSNKHIIIEGIHPSPLSANAGFFGSKPFSQINENFKKLGEKEIDWKL